MKNLLMIFSILVLSFSSLAKEKKVEEQVIKLTVTEEGFTPKELNVKPNVPVTLKITRKTNNTCSASIEVVLDEKNKDKNIKQDLPLNKEVKIKIGALAKGEIRFGCGMSMMDHGKILVN